MKHTLRKFRIIILVAAAMLCFAAQCASPRYGFAGTGPADELRPLAAGEDKDNSGKPAMSRRGFLAAVAAGIAGAAADRVISADGVPKAPPYKAIDSHKFKEILLKNISKEDGQMLNDYIQILENPSEAGMGGISKLVPTASGEPPPLIERVERDRERRLKILFLAILCATGADADGPGIPGFWKKVAPYERLFENKADNSALGIYVFRWFTRMISEPKGVLRRSTLFGWARSAALASFDLPHHDLSPYTARQLLASIGYLSSISEKEETEMDEAGFMNFLRRVTVRNDGSLTMALSEGDKKSAEFAKIFNADWVPLHILLYIFLHPDHVSSSDASLIDMYARIKAALPDYSKGKMSGRLRTPTYISVAECKMDIYRIFTENKAESQLAKLRALSRQPATRSIAQGSFPRWCASAILRLYEEGKGWAVAPAAAHEICEMVVEAHDYEVARDILFSAPQGWARDFFAVLKNRNVLDRVYREVWRCVFCNPWRDDNIVSAFISPFPLWLNDESMFMNNMAFLIRSPECVAVRESFFKHVNELARAYLNERGWGTASSGAMNVELFTRTLVLLYKDGTTDVLTRARCLKAIGILAQIPRPVPVGASHHVTVIGEALADIMMVTDKHKYVESAKIESSDYSYFLQEAHGFWRRMDAHFAPSPIDIAINIYVRGDAARAARIDMLNIFCAELKKVTPERKITADQLLSKVLPVAQKEVAVIKEEQTYAASSTEYMKFYHYTIRYLAGGKGIAGVDPRAPLLAQLDLLDHHVIHDDLELPYGIFLKNIINYIDVLFKAGRINAQERADLERRIAWFPRMLRKILTERSGQLKPGEKKDIEKEIKEIEELLKPFSESGGIPAKGACGGAAFFGAVFAQLEASVLRPLAAGERQNESSLLHNAILAKVIKERSVAVEDLTSVIQECYRIIYDISERGGQCDLVRPGELKDLYAVMLKTRQTLVEAIETGRSFRRADSIPFDVLIAIDKILTGFEDAERLNSLTGLQSYLKKRICYIRGGFVPVSDKKNILSGEDGQQARNRMCSYILLAVAKREQSLAAIHFSLLPDALQDAWFNTVAETLLKYAVDENDRYKRGLVATGAQRRDSVRIALNIRQFFFDLALSKGASERLKNPDRAETENRLMKYAGWTDLAAPDITGDLDASSKARMATFYGADIEEKIEDGRAAVLDRDSKRFCAILGRISASAYAGFSLGNTSIKIEISHHRVDYFLSALLGRLRGGKQKSAKNIETLLDMIIITCANSTGVEKLFPKDVDIFGYLLADLGFGRGEYYVMLESRRAVVRKGAEFLDGQWLGEPIAVFESGIDRLMGLFRSLPAPGPTDLSGKVSSKKGMSQTEAGI